MWCVEEEEKHKKMDLSTELVLLNRHRKETKSWPFRTITAYSERVESILFTITT